MSQTAPNPGAVLMDQLRTVLRGLIHQRWRSMRAFAAELGVPPDWVTNRVSFTARTAIDINDLAV